MPPGQKSDQSHETFFNSTPVNGLPTNRHSSISTSMRRLWLPSLACSSLRAIAVMPVMLVPSAKIVQPSVSDSNVEMTCAAGSPASRASASAWPNPSLWNSMSATNSERILISSAISSSHGPILASPNQENAGVFHIIGVIAPPVRSPGHAVTRRYSGSKCFQSTVPISPMNDGLL
ncbi:MAG: hypothetical protein BWY59_00809 [Verrucomicrobia bacterium ADurb.Bin345]|nr:MAG: hypothetical protein BWY59_00809 [Verrucomicrobia bacterium ADurb.Bin345]